MTSSPSVSRRSVWSDQRAGGQHQRLADLGHRHAVVEVALHCPQNGLGADLASEPFASVAHQRRNPGNIERLRYIAVFDRDGGLAALFVLGVALLRPLPGPLLAIKHIRPRHVVLPLAHEGKFNLILDVFNMQRAARGVTTHERVHDSFGEMRYLLAHPRRGSARTAIYRDECFRHRNGDFRRLETNDCAVAPNDLVLRVAFFVAAGEFRGRQLGVGSDAGCLGGDVHKSTP